MSTSEKKRTCAEEGRQTDQEKIFQRVDDQQAGGVDGPDLRHDPSLGDEEESQPDRVDHRQDILTKANDHDRRQLTQLQS